MNNYEHRYVLSDEEMARIDELRKMRAATLTWATLEVVPELREKGDQWMYTDYPQTIGYNGEEIVRPTFDEALYTFNAYGRLAGEVDQTKCYYAEAHGEDIYVYNYTSTFTGQYHINQVWTKKDLVAEVTRWLGQGWMLIDPDVQFDQAVLVAKLTLLANEIGNRTKQADCARHLVLAASFLMQDNQRMAEFHAIFANSVIKIYSA